MKHIAYSFLIPGFIFLVGCKSSTSPQPQTYTASPTSIGTGTATSWVAVDASGNMTAIGVTVSDAALASLPAMDTMFEIAMPPGLTTIPFKTVSLDYATSDAAPYNKPHLDAHFYLLDMMHRMNIMNGMDTMMPMGMMLPDGYMRMGESQAMMGVHYIDMNGPEYSGHPFQSAFVYGFSMGSMTFMEAMCDKAILTSHTALSGTVKQPMMMGMTMSIPASYKTSYDASAKTTTIELDGF